MGHFYYIEIIKQNVTKKVYHYDILKYALDRGDFIMIKISKDKEFKDKEKRLFGYIVIILSLIS